MARIVLLKSYTYLTKLKIIKVQNPLLFMQQKAHKNNNYINLDNIIYYAIINNNFFWGRPIKHFTDTQPDITVYLKKKNNSFCPKLLADKMDNILLKTKNYN